MQRWERQVFCLSLNYLFLGGVKLVRLCKIMVLLVLASSFASCTSRMGESPSPTVVFESPPLILEEGKGAIQGRLHVGLLPEEWQGRELYAYACPFFGPSDEEGFYVLEPSVHPNAPVSPEGFFRLVNLLPGTYVIVIGPSPEEAIAVQESGRVKVFHLQAGQVLDLGEVSLARQHSLSPAPPAGVVALLLRGKPA